MGNYFYTNQPQTEEKIVVKYEIQECPTRNQLWECTTKYLTTGEVSKIFLLISQYAGWQNTAYTLTGMVHSLESRSIVIMYKPNTIVPRTARLALLVTIKEQQYFTMDSGGTVRIQLSV